MRARDADRVGVVLRIVVGDAGLPGMHVGAAEFLGGDDLAGGGLHQRRPAEEDRALVAHDDALVRHRRHIGAAGGARAHHDRDLRNALRRHLRLVVEDAAEMPLVRENLVLLRQEGAAGIDHVDAGQVVLPRDILGAQMLLHRHRIIGAALDGGVVGDDHAFAARDPADPGDDAGGMHVAAIEAIGGERDNSRKAVPGSIRRSTRSRAKILPRATWRWRDSALPPRAAAAIFSRKTSRCARMPRAFA